MHTCDCDHRCRRWNPFTNHCESCGGTFSVTTPTLALGSTPAIAPPKIIEDVDPRVAVIRDLLDLIDRNVSYMKPEDQHLVRFAQLMTGK